MAKSKSTSKPRPAKKQQTPKKGKIDPGIVVDEDYYQVDKIVGKRRRKKGGGWEYRVRWVNCTEAEDTWEPEDNLCDTAYDEAMEFEASLKKEKKKPPKTQKKSAKPAAKKPAAKTEKATKKSAAAKKSKITEDRAQEDAQGGLEEDCYDTATEEDQEVDQEGKPKPRPVKTNSPKCNPFKKTDPFEFEPKKKKTARKTTMMQMEQGRTPVAKKPADTYDRFCDAKAELSADESSNSESVAGGQKRVTPVPSEEEDDNEEEEDDIIGKEVLNPMGTATSDVEDDDFDMGDELEVEVMS